MEFSDRESELSRIRQEKCSDRLSGCAYWLQSSPNICRFVFCPSHINNQFFPEFPNLQWSGTARKPAIYVI